MPPELAENPFDPQPAKGAIPTPGSPQLAENPFDTGPAPATGQASYLGASARRMLPAFGQSLGEVGSFAVSNLPTLVDLVDPTAKKRVATAITKDVSNPLGAVADRQMEGLSPEAQAQADKKYATLDPSKAAYLDPTRVFGDVVQNLPPLLLSLVSPALRARSLVSTVGKSAVGEAASQFALESAGTEGTIGYGQEAAQARQRAAQAQGTDGTDLLSTEAAQRAGAIGGAVDAASEAVGGKVLGHIMGEGGKFGARVVKGFLDQGATEAVQGAGEQLGENLAVKTTVNPQQDLFQDVPENVASSAVVGGVMGGAVAGPLGSNGQHQTLNPAQATGDAQVPATPEPVAEKPQTPIGRGQQGDLFTLDDLLDRGIATVESSGKPGQVSEKGALGKYQLMPATAKETAQKLGVEFDPEKARTDDTYARELARSHLQSLLQKYDGDKLLAVTAYNAGQGNVDSWVKRFGYDPTDPQAFLDQIKKVGNPRSAAYPQKVMAAMGSPLDAGGPVDAQGNQSVEGLDTLAHQSIIAALLRGAVLDENGNKLPFDSQVAGLSAKLSKALQGADVDKARDVLAREQTKLEKASNSLVDEQTSLSEGKAQHTPEEHDGYQQALDAKLEKLLVHANLIKTGHELVDHFEQAANTQQQGLFPQPAAAPAAVPAPAAIPTPATPVNLVTEPGPAPSLEPQPSGAPPAATTELAAQIKGEAANTVSADAQARTAMLDKILGDPETRDPTRRFVGQLKRLGMSTDIAGHEAERIGRYEAARDAFHDPTQPDHYTEPSAPDESGNFGIPERTSRPSGEPASQVAAEPPVAAPENAPAPSTAEAPVADNIRQRGEAKAETLGSSRRSWFLKGLDAALNETETPAPTSPSKASWFNEGKSFVAEERAHQEREAAAKAAPPKKNRSEQIKEAVAKLKKPAASRGNKTSFDTAVAQAEQKGEITSKDGVALRAAAEAAWDQGMWDALDTAKATHSDRPAATKFSRFANIPSPTGSPEVSDAELEDYLNRLDAATAELRTRLDKLGLHEVGAKVVPRAYLALRTGNTSVQGLFSSKEGRSVVMLAFESKRANKTSYHEAGHAMRQLDLFTPAEWRAIVEYGKAHVPETAGLYGNEPQSVQDEESAVEGWARWQHARDVNPPGLVRRAYEKITNFLGAIKSAFQGHGFTTAEDVFAKMSSGELGSRQRGVVRQGERTYASRFPEPVERASKNIGHAAAEAGKKGHIWMTFTEDLANMAKRLLPSANRLIELHSKNFALSRQFEERLLQVKEAYERLPAAIKGTGANSVNAFLYDSRMAGKWGFKPDYMPSAQVDPALEARFNRLPKPAQDVVQSVFRFNYDARNQLYKATTGAIDAEYDPLIAAAQDPAKAAEISADKSRAMAHFSRVFDTREGLPYTPLKREGMWVVVGRSNEYAEAKRNNDQKLMDKLRPQPDHYFVDMRDTVGEAEALRDHVSTKFGRENTVAFERSGIPDGEIGGPELYIAFQKLKEAVEGQLQASPGSKAAKELHRLATDLYLHTLSDTSARKGELSADMVSAKDPVTGEVLDMMRAFVTRGQATTHYVSSISNNAEMQETLRNLREELSATEGDDRKPAARFYNELLYRYTENLGHRPSRFLDKAARAVSFYNLLTTPMYYAQNASQAVLLSQPLLAGHVGYDKAAGAFAKAYADFAKMTEGTSISDRVDFSKAPADVADVMQRLAARGRLDAGLTHELGSWQMNGDGLLPKGWNAVDRFFRQVPQRVEVMNRVVTGMAAYRTMLAKTGDKEAAFQYASKLIYDSHGDYSGFNAPTPFHKLGNWSKIVLQFRKFQMIMASMLVKEFHKSFKGESKEVRNAARVGLFFTAAHMAAIGGIVGMPAANALGWAIGQALSAVDKDRRDEYHDWEEDLRTWLGAGREGADKNWVADFLFKGAPYALLNADLSGKLGLGTVLSPAPYSDADKALDSKDAYYQAVGQLLSGALGGIGAKAVDGWGYAQDGDIGRAAELMAPGGLANILKAHRQATQGVTSRQGDTLIKSEDISAMDEAMTLMGLTPRATSDSAQARSTVYEATQHYDQISTKLQRQYMLGDEDKRADVRQEWMDLQDARQRQGFKRQPLSNLVRTPANAIRRQARAIGGVEATPSDRRFVQDMMGDLAAPP